MALSSVSYVGNGSTNLFSVPFPYLDKTHVKVLVAGVVTTAFTFPTIASIAFSVVPPNSAVVLIQRVTPTTALVDFVNGSTLTESLLDTATLQSLYISEESKDSLLGALTLDLVDNKFEAASKVIKNLATPVNSSDAVTKAYVDLTTASSAASAAVSASNASTSAINSANSASASNTSATNSANSAAASNTSAINSANSAAAANISAINATNSANSVVYPSFRNKIIGGDFGINPWQRGTNFPALANASYSTDRWYFQRAGTSVQTLSRVADAPTAVQAGIYTGFCLGIVVTTAQTTLAASDYSLISQRIEGLNAASFGFGQAGSRNVTLSFWVKGAKLGIHCVAFRNAAVNRSYIAEYTISVINTWEYKTIVIPVDTAGTWLYDNGIGLEVMFTLAAGTTFLTAANSWQAGNFTASTNQVNELDTVGNFFKIDFVQLEIGSVATPFEVRDIGRELAMCLRYFIAGNVIAAYAALTFSGATTYRTLINFSAFMRVAPTVTVSGYLGGGTTIIESQTQSGFVFGANAPTGSPTISGYQASAEL